MTGWHWQTGYGPDLFPPPKNGNGTIADAPNSVEPNTGTQVSSEFMDADHGGRHDGIDVLIPDQIVRALAAGTVIFANWFSGYGRFIKILHPTGDVSEYGHNAAFLVVEGQQVEMGSFIGYQGGSGYGVDDYYGSHSHLNTRPGGGAVENPRDFMNRKWAEEVGAGLTAYPGGPNIVGSPSVPIVQPFDPNGGVNLNYWLTEEQAKQLKAQLHEFKPSAAIDLTIPGMFAVEYGVMQERLGMIGVTENYGILDRDTVLAIQNAVAANSDGIYGVVTNSGLILSIGSNGWGAITTPIPEEPTPTDPIPEDPEPTDPVPEEPTPMDPIPEDPEPTDPLPEEPEPEGPPVSDIIDQIKPADVPGNILGTLIRNATARFWVYSIFFLIVLVVREISIGYVAVLLAVQGDLPVLATILVVATAVIADLSPFVAVLAAANTNAGKKVAALVIEQKK